MLSVKRKKVNDCFMIQFGIYAILMYCNGRFGGNIRNADKTIHVNFKINIKC